MNQELSLAYPAKIIPDNNGFIVSFHDLENVFTEGDTYQKAVLNSQEVLDMLLLDMVENKMKIPKPSHCEKGEIPISVTSDMVIRNIQRTAQ